MSLDVQRIDRETGRAAVVARLRALLPVLERRVSAGVLPFGLPEIDRQLPAGGLAFDALHEFTGGATPTSRPPSASWRRSSAVPQRPTDPRRLRCSSSRAAASAPSARPTATASPSSASRPSGSSSSRPRPMCRRCGRLRRRCVCAPSRRSRVGFPAGSTSRRVAASKLPPRARTRFSSCCAPRRPTRRTRRRPGGESARRPQPATASAVSSAGDGGLRSSAAATGGRVNGSWSCVIRS